MNTSATVTAPSVQLESTSILYSSLILDGTITDGSSERVVTYNLNTTTPSTLIAPGQGFYVATDASGSVAFTPSIRRTVQVMILF